MLVTNLVIQELIHLKMEFFVLFLESEMAINIWASTLVTRFMVSEFTILLLGNAMRVHGTKEGGKVLEHTLSEEVKSDQENGTEEL